MKRSEKRPSWAQNIKFWSPKKRNFRPPRYRQVFFSKNRTHFGQIQPPQPCLWFTAAYRGPPPCTIFLTSREQGNIVQLCTRTPTTCFAYGLDCPLTFISCIFRWLWQLSFCCQSGTKLCLSLGLGFPNDHAKQLKVTMTLNVSTGCQAPSEQPKSVQYERVRKRL